MSSSSSWTWKQNDLFEKALDTYDEHTPDRWEKVARAVGGSKSVEEVKRHFELLNKDTDEIERTGGCSSSNNTRAVTAARSRGSNGTSDRWASGRRN